MTGNQYVQINNNFDYAMRVQLRSQLNATLMYDQNKRAVSDHIIKQFYPIDTQTENGELGNRDLGPYRKYRFKNFNKLNKKFKKQEAAEELRLKKEENAAFDQTIKKEEQAEESAKKAKADKKRAKNMAMVEQITNINIKKGLDLDVFMGQKSQKKR